MPPTLLLSHQNSGSLDLPGSQGRKGLVGFLQGENSDLAFYRNLRGKSQKLLAVSTGQVRH